MPRALAWSITASPRAPLCDMNPTRPGGGRLGPKVAFNLTAESVLRIPMQLGPISRMPEPRQISISSACRAAPSAPVSEKPEEITTRERTPLAAQSRAMVATASLGTTTTASSTGPDTSPIEVRAVRPWMTPPAGLMAWIGPR